MGIPLGTSALGLGNWFLNTGYRSVSLGVVVVCEAREDNLIFLIFLYHRRQLLFPRQKLQPV